MKQNLYNTGMLALLLAAMLLGSCMSDKDKGNEWKLVWEENFDGYQIDTTIWSKIPRAGSNWSKYMSFHDTLFSVENGNLILRGMPNTFLPNDTAPFLTGGVYTKDKKTFGLGRLEIYAKLYGAQGAWPALWMLPENAPYPNGGEIDIMEWYDHIDFVSQCVHSHYTLKLGIKEPEQSAYTDIDSSKYNLYAVELHQDSLRFFVNDVYTLTYPRIETDKEGQFPFDENNYYLLIDMQHNNEWKGVTPPDELPFKMAIDWVRFYEKQE